MMVMNNIDSYYTYDYQVNREDLDELARVVYLEAGSQGKECMQAVASVIVNRVESDIFPDTIHEVIHQKGQYSTAHVICNDVSQEAYSVAYSVLRFGSTIPEYVLYQRCKRPVKGTQLWKCINGEYFSM